MQVSGTSRSIYISNIYSKYIFLFTYSFEISTGIFRLLFWDFLS